MGKEFSVIKLDEGFNYYEDQYREPGFEFFIFQFPIFQFSIFQSSNFPIFQFSNFPMIRQFEDLPVWQDARKLTRKIYQVTKKHSFSQDLRLKSQLQSSSVSAMSNIAEGFEYQSKRQFIKYLYIAKGSAGELRSQLYVAFDNEYITESELDELKNEATAISKQCSGLITYLEQYKPQANRVQETDHDEFYEMIESWKIID